MPYSHAAKAAGYTEDTHTQAEEYYAAGHY